MYNILVPKDKKYKNANLFNLKLQNKIKFQIFSNFNLLIKIN